MSSKIKDIVRTPTLLLLTFGHREWFNWMSVNTYLKIAYVHFGAMTFYPALGLFTPTEWNIKLGEMIKLPSKI